ncbi:hypothetical protein DUNSADRAFT_9056 [Dunaliella salina]|nr:hypothetical protein DUNSADRAFT_9056 [Dunaliella salina]|eukprot:KAF5834312.1 hypothetical protein DUNSADRAFT_9056 [Dunaliella salina]
MASMQGQILRLEASSNMTSHGLLGKTLEDENVLPAPKPQQMRPKSASRRQRGAQGSGSFPPKSGHDNNGSGKGSGQGSGSFQGQYGSLNMQYDVGKGQHGSGTYPEGIVQEHQEMGRAEPFGGRGSHSGGDTQNGQEDPGERAIHRSGSRGNRPGSGPGLGMLGRSITRGNNNSKRLNTARAPTRSILKQPSAMPAEGQAAKAEEQSAAAAAAAAARPIKRMTSRGGGTSTGSGSFQKEGGQV